MNLQQAKVLLNKINALHRSIGLDENDVSAIERDLMLSYIRQLYEAYSNFDKPTAQPARPATPPAPRPEPVPPSPPKPERREPPQPEPRPEPKAQPTPPPPPQPEPEPAPQRTPPPAPRMEERAAPTQSTDPRIAALFRAPATRELSDKLSQRSVDDLTKAMSINDKLLYANELFGRDMSTMNSTLDRLNRLSSMGEAQPILVPFAERHDWAEEERAEVAESFIKLVRRRYA